MRPHCIIAACLITWATSSSATDVTNICNTYTGSEICTPPEATPWVYSAYVTGGGHALSQTSAETALAIVTAEFIRFWTNHRCSMIVPPSNLSEFRLEGNERRKYATAEFMLQCPNWTEPDTGLAGVTGSRKYICPTGTRITTLFYDRPPVCLGQNANLQIVTPLDQEQYGLINENYISTSAVNFKANPGAQNLNSPISWQTSLEYQTSGERGKFTEAASFTTIGQAIDDRPFNSTGGKLTISASATLNGSPRSAGPRVIYITGTEIPNDTITSQLISIYTGTTQRLLTGIAMKESDYIQFAMRTLYNTSARWPNESYDGGSHIGLMQMPTNKENAWDWLANTQGAADLLSEKMQIVRNRERTIRARHPGLRELTGIERENMALLLYGPESTSNLSGQYYIPRRSGQNSWEWAVNSTGNADGVAYADSVRRQIQ